MVRDAVANIVFKLQVYGFDPRDRPRLVGVVLPGSTESRGLKKRFPSPATSTIM